MFGIIFTNANTIASDVFFDESETAEFGIFDLARWLGNGEWTTAQKRIWRTWLVVFPEPDSCVVDKRNKEGATAVLVWLSFDRCKHNR